MTVAVIVAEVDQFSGASRNCLGELVDYASGREIKFASPAMANSKTPLGAVRGHEGIGEWLKFPPTVAAPSPEDRTVPCIYALSTRDAITLAKAGRSQLNFELWSIVLGKPPPVPGVFHRNRPDAGSGLISLASAHASFRGIKRPLADDNDGANVLVYVLKPQCFYEYAPNIVSVALKSAVPDDLVFAAYVRPAASNGGQLSSRGIVTHWGFVEADKADLRLPVEHQTRYVSQLW